jgi:hypothetical protein
MTEAMIRSPGRYRIHLPVVHRGMVSPSAPVGVGWTRDLSEKGVCIELSQRLRPKQSVRIRLQTDGGPIDIAGTVAWSGGTPTAQGGIPHGVEFAEVTADQFRALKDLLLRKGDAQQAGIRLPLEVAVTCHPHEGSGRSLEGTTGDISQGGMLLVLRERLEPGTALTLTLRTQSGPLTAEGTVIWADPRKAQAGPDAVRHGIRFTALGWSTSLSLGLVLAEPA